MTKCHNLKDLELLSFEKMVLFGNYFSSWVKLPIFRGNLFVSRSFIAPKPNSVVSISPETV